MTDDVSALPSGAELATWVAAKLCHDFVSPAGAINSGLDLLSDPSAADMRDDALGLITQSATKLLSLIYFCRVPSAPRRRAKGSRARNCGVWSRE